MFLKNTMIAYSVLLITSTKKSFEALGKVVGKTGKTISRWLKPADDYYEKMFKLSVKEFDKEKELILVFDPSLRVYFRVALARIAWRDRRAESSPVLQVF